MLRLELHWVYSSLISVVYSIQAYTTYILLAGFICVYAYISTRNEREFIAEKFNTAKSYERWKSVLRICQEGVVILEGDSVIFHNEGLKNILKSCSIQTNDIELGVRSYIILDDEVVRKMWTNYFGRREKCYMGELRYCEENENWIQALCA